MDFNAVIVAHVNWKRKFLAHLEGKEMLDDKVVEMDNQCELGKWIYSQHSIAATPAMKELQRKHADFHRMAAEALRSSRAMSRESAIQLVDINSAYGKASADCVNAIIKVRDQAAGAA